jgi:hypothetical protein
MNYHSKPQSNSRGNIQVKKKAIPIGKFKNWCLDFLEDKHGHIRASSSFARLALSYSDMAVVIEFQLRIQEVQG